MTDRGHNDTSACRVDGSYHFPWHPNIVCYAIYSRLAASSEPHLGTHTCGAAPAGRLEARHHRERTGLHLDLEGDTFA
jgi:hypothetical protein